MARLLKNRLNARSATKKTIQRGESLNLGRPDGDGDEPPGAGDEPRGAGGGVSAARSACWAIALGYSVLS
jgi:hypothetical protein